MEGTVINSFVNYLILCQDNLVKNDCIERNISVLDLLFSDLQLLQKKLSMNLSIQDKIQEIKQHNIK